MDMIKNLIVKSMNEVSKIFDQQNLSISEKFTKYRPLFENIGKEILSMEEEERKPYIEYLDKSVVAEDVYCYIYKISFLLQMTKNIKYFKELFQYVAYDKLTLMSRVFLYWQLTRLSFLFPEICDNTTGACFRQLHKNILKELENNLKQSYRWIPAEKRNQNTVLILTNQFLSISHGPTQTALDRCHVLQTTMGKDIFLINTAEMPRKLYLPFYEPFIGNFIPEYSEGGSFQYLEKNIAFYQCKVEMPDIEEMEKILAFIAEVKPSFIFSVGGNNFTADLCSKIVPVLTQACVNSLPVTEGQFFLMWRALNEYEISILKEFGIEKERIIESHFTFRIRPQEKQLSRMMFAIPEESFVLSVVGGRLDTEMTENFTLQLAEFLTGNPKVFIVFAGEFSSYHTWKKHSRCLETQTKYIGFQEDILAFYDVCDAYLNPPRAGGGTSAVEAMYKGKHVFTYPIGDVAHDAGPYYHITSLREINTFIDRWYREDGFREKEKCLAIERARELTDTGKAMKKIIDEVKMSKYYF